MSGRGRLLALVVAAVALDACAQTPAATPRPATWAQPLQVEGVANLFQITPNLYRSEQPTALGMKNLEKLGIRTVISLRHMNSDEDEVRGTNLRTEHVRIFTWNIKDTQVVDVMRILRKTENGPFLIHCQHGSDRTGLMAAMYRILEQGWSADDALAELTGGGYGYHSIWTNVRKYVRQADIGKLRAAIAAPPSPP
ncbi:MAG TPA: tyrosine-protein phosphatase [Steroidobacteraceae bacterium]|nr:tyrosine-protein phosphatase [Steroidobacteraceae bacterium]